MCKCGQLYALHKDRLFVYLQVLAFITLVTAAVARANVGDVNVHVRDAFVDDSVDLKSVFGYSVAIAVFVLIGDVISIVIRILGIGMVNQLWIIFAIIVSGTSVHWLAA